MKRIGFIGGYDKADLVLYIGKMLVEMGNSVLIVDATTLQRTKYIVPTIKPEDSYVTNFEGIDVAVGYYNFDEIKQGLGLPQSAPINYSVILLDCDLPDDVENFGVEQFDQKFFVTSFDMYSIRKGIEALKGFVEPTPVTRILFSRNSNKKDDEYLKYLTKDVNVQWNEETIYFPFEMGDQTAMYNNQKVSKIKLGNLSSQYKEQLIYVTYKILQGIGQDDYESLKRVAKKMQKGV